MHNVVPVETNTALHLTDDDKLRIGIAWDALSLNSRRAYQLAWRQLDEFLSTNLPYYFVLFIYSNALVTSTKS